MPVRAGLDELPVQAVSDAVAAHADRYLQRIFTARELRDCDGDHERLAARFAAKEATLKVLRPRDEAIPWSSIEVQRTAGGWPELVLSGKAAAKAAQEGITSLSVSLTHEAGRAAAVVVAELTPDRGPHPS